MTFEGYDRANLQREDLIIKGRDLLRRPYHWQPQPLQAVVPASVLRAA
jgi:hypothetical protein